MDFITLKKITIYYHDKKKSGLEENEIMNVLELLFKTDAVIFVYIMGIVLIMLSDRSTQPKLKVLPREDFCTCRGAQYNNSAGDPNQSNCYACKIPKKIWDQSYAGCTEIDDPGKIAYAYNIEGKQLPEFAGV